MNHAMNSDQIFATVEQIAATSGKNDKIAMVKACIGSDDFKRVMVAANDPTISYGIKNTPTRGTNGPTGAMFDERTWLIVAQMRDRTLTGNAMREAVAKEFDRLSPSSAELLKRVLLKDLRADFGAETVNKAEPGTIPDFPYMRCCLPKDAKLDEFAWAAGVPSQEKADGMFSNVDHEDTGEVFIYSRAGTMFPMEKFETLAAEVQRTLAKGTQSHGEMLVVRDGIVLAREIGNGILTSVVKGGDFGPGEVPIYMIWDQIPLSAVKPKGKYNVPYRERLMGIIRQIKDAPKHDTIGMIRVIPTRIVKSLKEAYAHYAELLAQGKEGTIIKNPTAIWRDGTSKEQVKLKLEFVVDLEVRAIVSGKQNGKNAGRAGSLACATADGLLLVDVTVKNEKMRDEVDANPNDWIGKIIAVKANGIMKPSESSPTHSLFLPRMVEAVYRTDKSTADTLQQVFDQEEAAKQGAALLKEAA